MQYTAVVYSTAVVLVASCLLTFILSLIQKDHFHSLPLHGTACMAAWRCRRARGRDRRRTPRSRRTPRCRGRRAGTAFHSLCLEATARRRHRGRRFLGTRLKATRRRGRRDTRTARRRRIPGRILGRGRRTTPARRRGLLSTESLRSGCYFPTFRSSPLRPGI